MRIIFLIYNNYLNSKLETVSFLVINEYKMKGNFQLSI